MFDFSGDGIRRSLEASLERLGLDRVDIALIHDPDDHFSQAIGEAYPALEALRAAGTVRAIGLGMNQADMLERFVRDTDIDVVLVAGRYSLLDDRAGRGLLPAAADRHVAVLVAGVFNSGILADPRSGARFDYRPASDELVARAKALSAIAAEHDVPLTRVALQFPLRNSAVSGVVVGCRSSGEVTSNLAEFTAAVPGVLWSDLDQSGLVGWAGVPEGEAQRF
jgi:D-threo-aldose 1-dehydrogenase